MGIPDYDEKGYPIPYDDLDIKKSHSLFRYIKFEKYFDKGEFISSAFGTSSKKHKKHSPSMSTDWKESIQMSGKNLFYRVKSGEVVAELSVEFLKLLDESVKVGCTPGPNNPHHTDVWGVKNQGRRQKMATAATYHFKHIEDLNQMHKISNCRLIPKPQLT